jgi:hypothetical protein
MCCTQSEGSANPVVVSLSLATLPRGVQVALNSVYSSAGAASHVSRS